MTIPSSVAAKLLSDHFPSMIYNPESKPQLLKTLKTAGIHRVAYAVIADGELVIVGEGALDRITPLFPGYAPVGHQKVITMSMITTVAKLVEVIFIPASSKTESKALESELKILGSFHDITNFDRNEGLFKRCLNQAGIDITTIPDTCWIVIDTIMLDPSGSEMGSIRKWFSRWQHRMTKNDYAMLVRIFTVLMDPWVNIKIQ